MVYLLQGKSLLRNLKLAESEHLVFDIYLSGIVAMQLHPGVGRNNGHGYAAPAKSVEECADMALEMIEVRRKVMANE